MEKFYSAEFLSGIGVSFRDNAMKSVMLSHFPASSPSPHSTPTCRPRLVPRARRIEEEESRVNEEEGKRSQGSWLLPGRDKNG